MSTPKNTIKVRQCCIQEGDTPRYEAQVGDSVVIRISQSSLGIAKIVNIENGVVVTELPCDTPKKTSTDQIIAIINED